MLSTEAVLAELVGAVFLTYSVMRRMQGIEGVGLVAVIWALVLFVAIPLTINAAA
jgi:hypothetical protein